MSTMTLMHNGRRLRVQTPTEVAEAKGVSRQAVSQAIKLGALHSIKHGARVYVIIDALYKAYLVSTPGQRRDLK